MELLKDKIDKTSSCVKLFTNTQWIISLDDNCTTPTSDDDIEYYEYNDINKEYVRNDIIKENYDDIKDNDNVKNNIHIFNNSISNNNITTDVSNDNIINEPVNLSDNANTANLLNTANLSDTANLSNIANISNVVNTSNVVNIANISNTVIYTTINDIKINKIDNNKLSPLEFFKQTLDLYEDDDVIRTKLFTFISEQKISIKYTKKGVSMIMDGITQNKWNIYICKLFSFLLDISFEYRKQQICETKHSNFIIKK